MWLQRYAVLLIVEPICMTCFGRMKLLPNAAATEASEQWYLQNMPNNLFRAHSACRLQAVAAFQHAGQTGNLLLTAASGPCALLHVMALLYI